MKDTCKKIASVLEWIIGIALALCLFLGGLGFIGFLIAFCVGGETAETICTFLKETYYAYLIKTSTITTLLCCLLQYFNGNAKWVNPFKKQDSERKESNE